MRTLLALVSILGLAACLLVPATARADGPQFGGCVVAASVSECELQAGPSVAVTVGKYESGKFSAGVLPGVGYGLVLYPQRWYSVGLALYGQLSVGGDSANSGVISGLMSFANYIRVGVGKTWMEQNSGPASGPWALLLGLGSDFGGSPKYVAAASAKAGQ